MVVVPGVAVLLVGVLVIAVAIGARIRHEVLALRSELERFSALRHQIAELHAATVAAGRRRPIVPANHRISAVPHGR